MSFVTGMLMSSNFLRPPNYQTNFFETPNNQLSARTFQTENKFGRTLKYQTPNSLAYLKFHTQKMQIYYLEISDHK